MDMMGVKKILKLLSLYLFIYSLFIYPLWFKVRFHITPTMIIYKAEIIMVILLILIISLILRKPSSYMKYVILNFLTIVLVAFLTYALPAAGISNFTRIAIIDHYELADVSGGGGGIPANWVQLKDNDATIDVQEGLEYFGYNKIQFLQGVITKEGELKGKKVLVLFQENIFSPFDTMIVYELDSSFVTTKLETDQGYRHERYPIINILVSPE